MKNVKLGLYPWFMASRQFASELESVVVREKKDSADEKGVK